MFWKNRITEIPKQLLKTTTAIIIVGGITTIIFDLFAFLLQISKDAIASGKIYLGLGCIVLYYTKNVAQSSIELWLDDMKNRQNEIGEMQISNRTAEVITKVRDKVFISEGNMMSSSKIMTSVKNYLTELWHFKLSLPSDVISAISALVTFIGFIVVTSIEIKNLTLFFSTIIVISLLAIFFSKKRFQCRNRHRKAFKELNEKEEEVINDILNIEPQDEKHSSYMINSYMESMKKAFEYQKKDWRDINKLHLYETIFNTLATIFIIGIKIFETGIANVNLETVFSIIAIQTIYSQIIEKIRYQIRSVEAYREKLAKINTFSPDVEKIFEVFNREERIMYSSEEVIWVPRFEVEYLSKENGYKLVNRRSFNLCMGDCLLLTGPSGSGKSTFMKMLTGKIRFKNVSLPNFVSVMHYSDAKLGCQDILSEVVLGDEYDEEKLIYILKGLNLYEKLLLENGNVIDCLRNTKAENYSNGQRQRFLIARMLYNLKSDVKIVAFDEVTNAQDNELVEQTVAFIKEYCKSKLLIIATHQVDLWQQVATKHFEFSNMGGKYEMIEKQE